MYLFARVAVTKYHRLGGLNNSNLFSHSSGGQEFKIKVSAGLDSPEASFLGLQMAAFSLCPHMVIPLCASNPGVSLYVQISSSYKDICYIGLGPILMGSF